MSVPPKCTLCNVDMYDAPSLARGTCDECAKRIGMVPMPELTRPARPCMRCNGLDFVRVIPRETTSSPGEYGRAYSAPMFVTYAPTVREGWLNNYTQPLDIMQGYGMLEMFICHACGFIEWYCPTVQQIPIHSHLNTERVNYASKDGPFR